MTNQTLIIGLDPGCSGGIAWQVLGCRESADAAKFPDTETDCANLLRRLMEQTPSWFAYLEKVHSTPQMGVSSAFTFGRGYGLLRGLLHGLAIPFDEVGPQRWQADLGLKQSGRKLAQRDSEKHNAIKAKAQQMFPWLKVTHATAAALLISEWGARQQRLETEKTF